MKKLEHPPKHLLISYMDNELSKTRSEDIRLHLDACPLCSDFLAKDHRLTLLLKEEKQDKIRPSINVKAKILSKGHDLLKEKKLKQHEDTKKEDKIIERFNFFKPILSPALMIIIILTYIHIKSTTIHHKHLFDQEVKVFESESFLDGEK